MEFIKCLAEQLRIHRHSQPRDVVKMCYQAAFGAEHLLGDLDAAREYFYREYHSVEPVSGHIFEPISPYTCRVNMGAWRAAGLDPSWLFNMFVSSIGPQSPGDETFLQYLTQAEELIGSGTTGMDLEEYKLFIQEYLQNGISPVHHSDTYRQGEKPAYRLADCRFMTLLPVLEKISYLPNREKTTVIAIDGPAASGKSTLGRMLQQILGAGVVHMDDFFLPGELRTEERLSEAGGNIHYERFVEQVLPYVSDPKEFSYQVFDCSAMAMGEMRTVSQSGYRIVEGSYSHHPRFGNFADLRIFIEIDAELQKQRIINRNGEALWKMFHKAWIPLENKYFENFAIKLAADLVVSGQ
ncbi:MAG: (d)CMP kinase [Clostridia bacterium]|nr:(d)CMP kinase [Clostridia bacterium]